MQISKDTVEVNVKSEFKKDDCVTLHIEDIGTGGEGIGKADGFTFL